MRSTNDRPQESLQFPVPRCEVCANRLPVGDQIQALELAQARQALPRASEAPASFQGSVQPKRQETPTHSGT